MVLTRSLEHGAGDHEPGARVAVDQRRERHAGEPHELRVAHCVDGGRARYVLEQRDLAGHLGPTDLADLHLDAVDGAERAQAAGHDEVPGITLVALTTASRPAPASTR